MRLRNLSKTLPILPLASLSKRLLACLYDGLVIIAIAMLITLLIIAVLGDARDGFVRLFLQLMLFVVIGAYFVTSWVKSGQTIAMRAWRIKVVDQHHAPLSHLQAIKRYCLTCVLMLSGVSILWAIFDRQKLFLHDRLLGTKLIDIGVLK